MTTPDAAHRLLFAEGRLAEISLQVIHADLDGRLDALEHLDHRLSHDAPELLLEVSHPGLPRIPFDDPRYRRLTERDVLRLRPAFSAVSATGDASRSAPSRA